MGRWDSLALDSHLSRSESLNLILALQVWGLDEVLTTPLYKKELVTETDTGISNVQGIERAEAQDSGLMTQHQGSADGFSAQAPAFMMDDGQTQMEANNQTPSELLKPKLPLLIGTWNVRTLYQAGKLNQATKEMDRYSIDIMAICESRWTGVGKRKLASGHDILFSGRDDDLHLNGVALILSKKIKSTLIEWEPKGERLLKARFNSRFAKLTIIVCYAPQEEKSPEEKDEFYDQLTQLIHQTPKHDVLLVLGDLNAKIGNNNHLRESYMGKHGLGPIMNDNGERLADFCMENNLVIGGTLFQHKNIHKYTWTSPDSSTQNQIDHIMVNKKWRTSLENVKTRRGADIGSDHELLVCKLKLKLRKAKRQQTRQIKFDFGKLKNQETAEKFKLEIQNRFDILQNDQEINIDKFNQQLVEASNKILGHPRKKKEQWISDGSWTLIEERKKAKQKLLEAKSSRLKEQRRKEYTATDKEVKKSTRADKKVYYENLAQTAERAAERNDMKTLYQVTKALSTTFRNSDVPIKDAKGKTIANEKAQMERWKEHFETILNREAPRLRAQIKEAETDLDINTDPPTIEEIRKAIQSLNNGKASGEDQITAEMLKAEGKYTPLLLSKLFTEIWNTEEMPSAWNTGLIVKLPKKGNLADCGNWRGIMLLSVTSKVFSRIVLNRINSEVEPALRKQQAGFRKGKSCTDHIFTLRQIFEQCQEWNATLYANFIDFEKAFDSLHRPALWDILRHYGIPQKIVNIVKMLYQNFSSKVICGQELSGSFRIDTGVKQGCILSPFLFLLAIDWIMKTSVDKGRTGIPWTFTETLEDLDFADDIVLLSQKFVDLQNKSQELSRNAQKLGLKINTGKTKTMRMNSSQTEAIQIAGTDVEDVKEFTYLGTKVSQNGNTQAEISERLTKARKAFGILNKFWKSNQISTKTKLKIFKSNVLSVLLYGAESWKTTEGIRQKLDVFQNKCLRRIFKIFWPQKVTNQDLLTKAGMEQISITVKRRRWRWLGHTFRMLPQALPKIALRWTPQGQRGRGRPSETWRRTVDRELREKGWTWGEAQKKAQNREAWRSEVSALCVTEHDRG